MRADPFEGIGRAALSERIADARLSKIDRFIAERALIDKADFIEIGAEVGYSRSTVSRRYQRIIKML